MHEKICKLKLPCDLVANGRVHEMKPVIRENINIRGLTQFFRIKLTCSILELQFNCFQNELDAKQFSRMKVSKTNSTRTVILDYLNRYSHSATNNFCLVISTGTVMGLLVLDSLKIFFYKKLSSFRDYSLKTFKKMYKPLLKNIRVENYAC